MDAANAITYSNVIFVPNNGNGNEADTNNLIDPSQAYILSSDPRFFGSYIRGNDEEEVLVNETADSSAVALEYHGYHIQSDSGKYIETITNCDHQEVVDPATGDTQIIIQGANGQFYRQIQNVYVNDGQKVDNSVDMVLNNEGIYDHQAMFHTQYDDLHQHMEMKSTNDMVSAHPLDGLSIMPTVADAELLINSGYEGYKPEYNGLDNDGLLAAHHLIDLGGEFSGTTGGSMTRTPLAEELAFLERQHERNLLESTMSPLCKLF